MTRAEFETAWGPGVPVSTRPWPPAGSLSNPEAMRLVSQWTGLRAPVLPRDEAAAPAEWLALRELERNRPSPVARAFLNPLTPVYVVGASLVALLALVALA